jgi:DNA (cytosine-5)-methyltransferase 1
VRVLDLFSGIGGFSLGLERAGFTTVAFCEIEPYCRAVLKKHWPHVPCYEDVRTLTAERLRADGISVDVICGGFPCQDISFAGKGAGIEGERSGLWREYARIVGEIRPRYVVVENVSALLGRGLDVVLGDLSEIGFDAEWHCIPASAVGAPHRRDRIWIVAYPGRRVEQKQCDSFPLHLGRQGEAEPTNQASRPSGDGRAETLANTNKPRLAGQFEAAVGSGGQWSVEPDVGRVAHGVPSRVDRLRALGNAVVPQIPEIIGRAILAAEAA